jgi:hypothetical protein
MILKEILNKVNDSSEFAMRALIGDEEGHQEYHLVVSAEVDDDEVEVSKAMLFDMTGVLLSLNSITNMENVKEIVLNALNY